MLKTFAWCVRVLVFILLLGLAIKNSGPVTLHFFFNSGWELPVVMVLLAAFGLGALCGATVSLSTLYTQRREIGKLRDALGQHEQSHSALARENERLNQLTRIQARL